MVKKIARVLKKARLMRSLSVKWKETSEEYACGGLCSIIIKNYDYISGKIMIVYPKHLRKLLTLLFVSAP